MIANIDRITLILGTACNMNCSYCGERDGLSINVEFNPKIIPFIKKVSNPNTTILFFGGEPLIYLDKIKEIISLLGDMKYGIFTNGKLIDRDFVSYVNEHNISVILSWDGFASNITRGYDAVKDKEDLLLDIEKLSIHSVVSRFVYPKQLVEDWTYIEEKYFKKNKKRISLNEQLVRNDLFSLDNDRLSKEMEEIVDKTVNGTDYATMSFCVKYTKHFEKYYTQPHKFYKTICSNGYTSLNLDIAGNLYGCSFGEVKVGDIDSNYFDYLNDLLELDKKKPFLNKCKDCIAISTCREGCRFHQTEKLCENNIAIATAIFNSFKKHGLIEVTEKWQQAEK